MRDEQKFRKKYFWALLSSYATLIPVGMGALICLGSLLPQVKNSALGIFAGVCTAAVGVGAFVWRRFVNEGNAIAVHVHAELEQEAKQAREDELDELDRKLRRDSDSRTQVALRDLRRIREIYDGDSTWMENINPVSLGNLVHKVDQMFEACVRKLHRTLEIRGKLARINTATVRAEFDDHLNQLIVDVQKSVLKLGEMIGRVERLSLSHEGRDHELERLSREMDDTLSVAEEVDRTMRDFDDEIEFE